MLGQFGELLRAIAGGPDPASIPPPGEVIPTINVSDGPPDWDYCKGLYRYAGYAIEAAGGAGARSVVGLWNPSGTTAVGIVRHISANSDDDILALTTTDVPPGADDGTENPTDSRLRVGTYINRYPVLKVRSQSTTFLGEAFGRIHPYHDDGTKYFFDHTEAYIVWPGTGICVIPTTDNKAITASFWWTERKYDPEELRGVRPGIFD